MKKIICLFLACLIVFSLLPSFTIAAENKSEIYTVFKEYEKYATQIKDTYCNVDVDVHTYVKIKTTTETCIAVYIINHSMPKIGTEDDISIIRDLLEEYIVVVLDYNNAKEAVSPNLEWGVNKILNRICDTAVLGVSYKRDHIYQIPSGYRLVKDITYFELDKHAPNGTINYILDVWNRYYAGNKTDANGKLLPFAKSIDECIKKDGTPIDLELKLDIVYPSKPKETVPVFMLAASSETSRTSATRADRPIYTGMLFNGYAAVCYDHEYIPMSRNDHYGYLDKAFSLYKYTANKSHSAAVRKVRLLADDYGFNADYMGAWGFSKSSTGPAWLSDITHLEKGEVEYFADKYNPNGEDPKASPEKQPWLTYENGKEVSSNITVTYPGSGPGFHYHSLATAPVSKENSIAIVHSSGEFDTTGNFFKQYYNVLEMLVSRDIESLSLPIDNIAHTFPQGIDEKRGIDYYKTYFDFFDNQIRAAYRKEPPKVLWITPKDKSEHSTVNIPVEVKFTRSMNEDTVKNSISITDDKGDALGGVWNAYNGSTRFVFTSPSVNVNSTYTIKVNSSCKTEDGVELGKEIVQTFKVCGDEMLIASKDAYVESGANADKNFGNEKALNVSYENDIKKEAYIGFNRENGFGDVTKATLLIKCAAADYQNQLSGLYNEWDENTITFNNAPKSEVTKITVFGADKVVNTIDVTDYVKGVLSDDLTFNVSTNVNGEECLYYDFEDMASDGFKSKVHYRLGGQGASKEEVVTEEAYEGKKSLKFSERTYANRRMKIYNSFKSTPFTKDDIGMVYKVEFYIKPEISTNINFGTFADAGTSPVQTKTVLAEAGKWNKISGAFVVDEEMVKQDARLLGFETSEVVPTLYIDSIKVSFGSDANEIVSKEGATSSHPVARLIIETDKRVTELKNAYIKRAVNNIYSLSDKTN